MWNNYYDVIGVGSRRHQPPIAAGHDSHVIVKAAGADPERDEALFAVAQADVLERRLAAEAVIAASKLSAPPFGPFVKMWKDSSKL